MQPTIPEVWQECSAVERDILTVLAIDAPLTVSAIHRRIGRYVTYESVSRNISHLADRDLLVRERNEENARFADCALTEIGRDVVRVSLVALAEDIDTALGTTVAGPEAEDRV